MSERGPMQDDHRELLERRIIGAEESLAQLHRHVHRMTNYVQGLLLRLEEHITKVNDEIALLRQDLAAHMKLAEKRAREGKKC